METDLGIIERMAEEKEEENWGFRLFLKNYDAPIEEMDAIVHGIYDDVSSRIDCTTCANCCIYFSPVFNEKDIHKISEGMGISIPQFEAQFLEKNNEESGYVVKCAPCPFLRHKLCTQYSYRPEACASFPHLHKADFVFRLMGVINNYRICPIVYNVFEVLKDQLWSDRRSPQSRSGVTKTLRANAFLCKRKATHP